MFGCVKNEWIIEDRRSEESVNSSDNDKNKYIVYFNSRMLVSTSSDVTLFPKDCKAQIFVFIDTEGVQSQESPVYESLTAGTLTPTAKPMVLLKGTYNFYAVSVKTDTLPPPFSNNIANYLANGTDYLWDGIEDYGITVDGTVINVVFSHCASQIIFNISNDDIDVGMDSLTSGTLGVIEPTTASTWNLTTGVISQVNSTPTAEMSVNVDGLTASAIFLPYNDSTYNTVTFQGINTKGETEEFTASFALPDSGFQGGKSYQYEILFKGDTAVIRDGVEVLPWVKNVESNIDYKFTY